MDDEKIKAILEKVESVVKSDGYCRAGFAIKEVMEWTNNKATATQRFKIAAKATITGEYQFDKAHDKDYVDFNIFKNVEYERLNASLNLTNENLKSVKINRVGTIINIILGIINLAGLIITSTKVLELILTKVSQ